MDHWKEPLDLEIGDTIIWRGEGMRSEEGMILISPGMRGKVITRSENLLAHAARKAGMPINAGPWVLVEFENGFRMVVDSRASSKQAIGLASETGTSNLNQLREVRSILHNKSSLSFAEGARAGKKLLARV